MLDKVKIRTATAFKMFMILYRISLFQCANVNIKNEGKIKNKHVGKTTILFFIKHEKSEFVRGRNQELVFHSVRRAINIENMAVMKEIVK